MLTPADARALERCNIFDEMTGILESLKLCMELGETDAAGDIHAPFAFDLCYDYVKILQARVDRLHEIIE